MTVGWIMKGPVNQLLSDQVILGGVGGELLQLNGNLCVQGFIYQATVSCVANLKCQVYTVLPFIPGELLNTNGLYQGPLLQHVGLVHHQL